MQPFDYVRSRIRRLVRAATGRVGNSVRVAVPPEEPDRGPTHIEIYVDDSVESAHDFVVASIAAFTNPAEADIRQALRESGLRPYAEEYKSSAPMARDPRMRDARGRLATVLRGARLGYVVASLGERDQLGTLTLDALETIFGSMHWDPARAQIYLDEGFFPGRARAEADVAARQWLEPAGVFPEMDSKRVLGLQAADLAAYMGREILVGHLVKDQKEISLGPEKDTGYPEDMRFALEWAYRMGYRYNLIGKGIEAENSVWPGPGPFVCALGYGVHMSPGLPVTVREAVERAFDRVWLGCIH